MKILFVYPEIGTRSYLEPHLGLCTIAAVLRARGHQSLLLRPMRFSPKKFIREVDFHRPDMVAFSSTTHQYPYVQRYLDLLKGNRHIPTIIGGVHATMASEEVIAEPNVDMVCRGEGEMPMLRVAEAMAAGEDTSRIKSIWAKTREGEIIRNEIGPLVEDLDELPFPDREFFGIEAILRKNGYKMAVLAGRGCPYSCSYCSNRAYGELYGKNSHYVRKRSVGNVIEELRMLKGRYHIKIVAFQDEVFVLDRQWLREFSERYRREIALGFQCLARPEQIDNETVSLLKDAGCLSVSLGVETGNEDMRQRILNRMTSNEQILNAFRLLKESGIDRLSFNMIGIPGETAATIEESIAFARRLDPDWIGLTLYHPYPGTPLAEHCYEKGYVIKEEFNPSYGADESMLALPSISAKELTQGYRKFENYAFALYVKNKYPLLYPLYVAIRPILKSPLRRRLIELSYRLIHERGLFRKSY